MNPMHLRDKNWIITRLPRSILNLLLENPDVFLAGGFIRSCIANEPINDIDLFCGSAEKAKSLALNLALANDLKRKPHVTDNAITLLMKPYTVQFITRWTFPTPEKCAESFDFTIARAVFYADPTANKDAPTLYRFVGKVDPNYYADLAGKQLVYCNPVREEEPGGSMLRVLKFYQRGYRIPLDSFADVMTRLVLGVDANVRGGGDANQLSKALCGLLREVDPNIDPLHQSHLPTTNTQE